MSWQAYVDTSLIGSGAVDRAAIFSADGTSVWAHSAGFDPTPQELQAIVHAYKDNSTPKQIQTSGLHVAKERFIVLKADDTSVYGKKGKEGIVIVKTVQALLITHYPENVQPGVAAKVVEQLGDYLKGLGY